jgi:hypothetical protein
MQSPIKKAFEHSALPQLLLPEVLGGESLPAWFDVSLLASASIGAAASALSRLHQSNTGQTVNTILNQRHANLWFGMTLKTLNFQLPKLWDSIAGDYQTEDGWIRLHTNALHHKRAALSILNCEDKRDSVAKVVNLYPAEALETAIVEAGGCEAQMRSIDEWQTHPHGRFLQDEALVNWRYHDSSPRSYLNKSKTALPLSGVRVLDLTRILAGPVASRFLAGFGADVLRLDPPEWDEPGVIPEVTLGKRCASINLKSTLGKQRFIQLLMKADVLLHGYRADALTSLGFSDNELNNINPNLIQVSLNAYGWTGPWKNRRGFDSLMQMSCGIAHYGMLKSAAEKPVPLPVQALDHATGYFLATAIIQAIELRNTQNIIARAQCSLAATAHLLQSSCRSTSSPDMPTAQDSDYCTEKEITSWGEAHRFKFPVSFDRFAASWPRGASSLGSFNLENLDWH